MRQDSRHEAQEVAGEQRLSNFSTYDVTPAEAFKLIEAARDYCPIARSDRLEGFSLVMGYDDVRRAALDWRGFSSTPSALRPLVARPPALAIDSDPPEHSLRRSIIALVLDEQTPGRIEGSVRDDISELLDSLEGRDECDLAADFAEQVALRAICHIFGFAADQGPEIRRLSVELLTAKADPERGAAAVRAFRDFSMASVLARRGRDGDGPLSRVANARIGGRLLDPDQIASLMIGLLIAGHETTVSGLASLLYETLSRPKVRDRLAADHDLVALAVEEALRLNPPVFGLYRRVTRDTKVAGIELPANETVYLCWAAANRDPGVFEDPNAFRLDRTGKRHLAFGFGIHKCPAAAIARMEMELALTGFLCRFPQASLIGADDVEPSFGGSETMAIRSLPARLR
jgi:cytochrome P450